MQRKRTLVTLLTTLILALVVCQLYAAPPFAYIQKAKDIVESARYQLPVQAGPGLMLTQVSYNSESYSLVYRYYYTVAASKPTTTAQKEAKLGMIHMLKANPNSEEMSLLKGGITFHYNYYTEAGDFLYAIKITPTDIK